MDGPERLARRLFADAFHVGAAPLYRPPEGQRFHVITARTEAARSLTLTWLMREFDSRVLGLHMLKGARTYKAVIAFKASVLQELGTTDYAEDNRTVVLGLRRRLPACRVWHYRGVREGMVLDYEAPL
jgi:hypothetical protein